MDINCWPSYVYQIDMILILYNIHMKNTKIAIGNITITIGKHNCHMENTTKFY